MLLIYQIGDVPLFDNLRATSEDAISVKNGRSWRSSTAEFFGTSGDTFVGDPYRANLDSPVIDISGKFICTDGNQGRSLISRLQSFAGLPQIPIIGFYYEECDHVDTGVCCGVCNPTLDWIVNYGIITKISNDSNYFSAKDPFEFMVNPISISMQVGPKWKSVNKYEWDYRFERNISPYSPVTNTPSNYVPRTLYGLRKNHYFYKWNTNLAKYDPTFWNYKHSDLIGGVGSGFIDIGSYDLHSPTELWSAPPNSVYAFTGANNLSAYIQLKVARNLSLFDLSERIETSTLSILEINTDMRAAGYGGIYESDYIVTGYAAPFPGFVVRNGNVLPVRPRWYYPGLYPGETGSGFSRISVECGDTSLKMAYLHDFGMY